MSTHSPCRGVLSRAALAPASPGGRAAAAGLAVSPAAGGSTANDVAETKNEVASRARGKRVGFMPPVIPAAGPVGRQKGNDEGGTMNDERRSGAVAGCSSFIVHRSA